MNKRQKKKRCNTICERIEFFRNHLIYSGRKNGKSTIHNKMMQAIDDKKYRPFKDLKKEFRRAIVSIDYSNGEDYSVETTCRRVGNKMEILNCRII